MKSQELRLLPFLIIFLLLFAFSLIFPAQLFARSGCCSHHGGVCGCGCCDGTGLSTTCAPYYPQCSQPVYTVAPIKTVAPVIYTPKPTVKAAATTVPTPTATTTPQVKASASPTAPPTPVPQSSTSGQVFGWFILGGIVLFLVRIFTKKEKKTEIPIS